VSSGPRTSWTNRSKTCEQNLRSSGSGLSTIQKTTRPATGQQHSHPPFVRRLEHRYASTLMADILRFEIETTPFTPDFDLATYDAGRYLTRDSTNPVNFARFVPLQRHALGDNRTTEEIRAEQIELLLKIMNGQFRENLPAGVLASATPELAINLVTVFCREPCQPACRRFPLLDFMEIHVRDSANGQAIESFFGGNFSSPLRDKTFYLDVPRVADEGGDVYALGDFDAAMYELVFRDVWPGGVLAVRPVVAIAVSERYAYERTSRRLPGLGVEYRPTEPLDGKQSLTDAYYAKLGFRAKTFLAPAMSVPLRVMRMHQDSLEARSPVVLAALVSVMGPFQTILRGDLYRSKNTAGNTYRPDKTGPMLELAPTFPPYDLAYRNKELGPRQALATRTWLRDHDEAIRKTMALAGVKVAGRTA